MQVYVPQYLASVFTITIVIVIGIVQIGPGPDGTLLDDGLS